MEIYLANNDTLNSDSVSLKMQYIQHRRLLSIGNEISRSCEILENAKPGD
jgi:hypothetical protein